MALSYSHALHQGRKSKFFVGFFIFIFVATMTIQPLVFSALAAPGDLSITCDNVSISGSTWTFTGTWRAVDFPGQSSQYDTAMFSPTATLADVSSKDLPDTFQITTGPTEFAGHSNNPDMSGTWSNQVIFATTPSAVFATLYHAGLQGAETSGDAFCAFTLPPTLTLQKTVVKNNGGTAVDTDWTLSASGPTPISGVEGSAAVTNATVNAGAYVLSENNGPSGYTASQYSCIKNGGSPINGNSLTLVAGDDAVCTITNDDNAPTTGTFHIVKILPNDNGGTATADQFSFSVNGGSAVPFELNGQNDLTVDAGTYSVVETNPMTGYTLSYNNCSSIVIPGGGEATCTITNDDQPGTLIIKKQTTGWFGTFGFTVSNQNQDNTGVSPFDLTTDINNNPISSFFDVFTDIYEITEDALSGWDPISATCDNQDSVGAVHVGLGQTVTCTFVNDALPGTLTVIKHIADNRDGAPQASDFTISVSGGTPGSFPGSETGTEVSIPAGTNYLVEETDGPDGYAVDYSGDCGETMNPGGDNTCTVTNTPTTGSLTVRKVWIEDNGGGASDEQLTLTVSNDNDFSQEVTSGQSIELSPETYTVSESNVPGYTQSFSGDCDGEDVVDVVEGESRECIITNDDIKPTLTIYKQVSDGKEEYQPSFFDIFVDLNQVDIGDANGFNAGTHQVSESLAGENSFPGGVGYTQGFTGACDEDGNVTLNPGDEATCTITNTITYTQCIDGIDNDDDDKIDSADPSCHTDGNPDNEGSYNPGDNYESDDPDVTPLGVMPITKLVNGQATTNQFILNAYLTNNNQPIGFPNSAIGSITGPPFPELTAPAGTYAVCEMGIAPATNGLPSSDSTEWTIAGNPVTPYFPDSNLNIPCANVTLISGQTTETIINNIEPLIISNEQANEVTQTSATISWQTNHNATSRVVYDTVTHSIVGVPPKYDYAFSTDENSDMVTSHSVVISGLTPGTTYYFRPISHGSPEVIGNQVSATTLSSTSGSGGGGSGGGSGGGGGGGSGSTGTFINGPLANPPQVAGASIVATPTPQVAGAMTVLPATGASMLDRILMSLFAALLATGALMLLAGYEILPRKILRKIR